MRVFKAFLDFKIATKVMVMNGLAVGIFLLVLGYASFNLFTLQNNTRNITNEWLPAVKASGEIDAAIANLRIQPYKHIITPDLATKLEIEKTSIIKHQTELDNAIKDYKDLKLDKKERELFNDFERKYALYTPIVEKVLRLSRENRSEEASKILIYDSKKPYFDVVSTITELKHYIVAAADREKASGEATFNTSVMVFALVGLAISVLVGALSFWFGNLLSKPINNITTLAQSIASGDLSKDVECLGTRDELGLLSEALDTMTLNLRTMVMDLKRNAESVASASGQLATNSNHMKTTAVEMSSISRSTGTMTDELDMNIKTVASAVEQSTANIKQVFSASENVEKSVNTVDKAANHVSII